MNISSPALKLDEVEKHFGRGEQKTRAVDGVSFEVPRGVIFGFLGPNGAGKTTAIRCIMDFLRPTSGQIQIFGKDAQTHAVELHRSLGYLSGQVRLYDKWTGADHIRHFSALHGGAPAADTLVKRLELDTSLKAKTLSSGNRQKLGLVLAFMHNPELLIMDEPTNALDPLLQQHVYELLDATQKRGATVFMSSHNLPEVEKVCSEVAIIRKGKLVTHESIVSLRKKRLYVVQARFSEVVTREQVAVHGATIESFEEQDGSVSVQMRVPSQIKSVVSVLAQYALIDLEVQRASLEDIFLEHYSTVE